MFLFPAITRKLGANGGLEPSMDRGWKEIDHEFYSCFCFPTLTTTTVTSANIGCMRGIEARMLDLYLTNLSAF